MDRTLMERLIDWKHSPRRKPLVLNGARQVGKTWLLKEFGKTEFENVAYVSLDSDSVARGFFDSDFNIPRIVAALSLELDCDIRPDRTLIVLDEVQSCPRAITSLKYFCEDAPQYAVAAAGSLLGVSATEGTGFPVGKVNMLDLYPLSFLEFLDATDNKRFADLVRTGDTSTIDALERRFSDLLKQYYLVGGMPEAVVAFADGGDFKTARAIQYEILDGYVRDFAKHIPPRLLARTMLVWDSIPKHLSKENKKFVFGQVRKGARASDFEECLVWLEQAGLIRKVRRVSKPGLPLSSYPDAVAYKVFLVDVGLLGALCDLNPSAVLEENRVFTEFKGALTEQYVCQQLISSCGLDPFYWSAENSSGEIDFLVQDEGRIYPIEVKAEENLRSKSLAAFNKRFADMNCRRFSLASYRDQNWMRNVPLYAIGNKSIWE